VLPTAAGYARASVVLLGWRTLLSILQLCPLVHTDWLACNLFERHGEQQPMLVHQMQGGTLGVWANNTTCTTGGHKSLDSDSCGAGGVGGQVAVRCVLGKSLFYTAFFCYGLGMPSWMAPVDIYWASLLQCGHHYNASHVIKYAVLTELIALHCKCIPEQLMLPRGCRV